MDVKSKNKYERVWRQAGQIRGPVSVERPKPTSRAEQKTANAQTGRSLKVTAFLLGRLLQLEHTHPPGSRTGPAEWETVSRL